jgi:uncharacterized integral membrane protein
MRTFCLLLLLLFAGAAALFAYQNQQEVTLAFLDRDMTATIALVVGGAYLLGMFSGWSILGLLRRSIHRMTDRR